MATEKVYWIESEGGKEWYMIKDRHGETHDGGRYQSGIARDPETGEEYPEHDIRWPKVKGIRPHTRVHKGRRYWTGRWIYERSVKGKKVVEYCDTYEDALAAQLDTLKSKEELAYEKKEGLTREKGLTVTNAILDYLDDCRAEMTEGTMIYKEKFLKDFAKAFPKRQLTSIKKGDVRRFLRNISKDRGLSIFHRYHREINALYNWARLEYEDDNVKISNPAKLVPVNGKTKKHRNSYIPEDSELQQVIDHAFKIRDKNSQPYNLLVAYRDTWARKFEVFKWTWKDHVDWDRFDGQGGVRLVSGKSDKYADVWLPMSDDLRQCLRDQQEQNFGDKWVFEVRANALKGKKNRFGENAYGGRVTDGNAMIKDLCKAAGLPKDHWFNFHAIRKNRITHALNVKRKPINKVSQFARHTDISHTTPYLKESTENLLDMVQ